MREWKLVTEEMFFSLESRVRKLEIENEEIIKELRTLPTLLNQLVDSVLLSSNPGHFVRRSQAKNGNYSDGSAQTTEEQAALNRAEGEGMTKKLLKCMPENGVYIRAKFPPEYK